MNFKKILSLLVAVMLFVSVSASAKTLEFTMGETTAYESDGKIEAFETENAPYTKNDRTMVPVRVISEKFGANVEWVEETQQVKITSDGREIVLTLGSNDAYINGEKVTLDVSPEEFNGRTMVPLRFISESLGMNVEYVEPTEQILITDNEAIMNINGVDIYYDDFAAALVLLGYDCEQHHVLGDGVEFAIDAFIELYGSSSYLNSLGVTPPETYSDEVGAVINPYKAELSKTILTAPVAKLLASDCFVTDYVYTYCQTDEALNEALEIYKSDFVSAKHILFLAENEADKAAAKKKAEDTLKKLKKGADFDALMNELSQDPGLESYPQGYTFTYGEMVPEFEKTAFALDEGEISEIVETSYGYHILKREPLAPVEADMSGYLLEMLAERIYQQVLYEAKQNANYVVYLSKEEIVDLMKK